MRGRLGRALPPRPALVVPPPLGPPVATVLIPANALVLLVGASGCGKTTWTRARFQSTETVSTDECRRLVADDEGNQAASRHAFEVFRAIVRGRLAMGRLAVADATHLSAAGRREMLDLAAPYARPVVALLFDVEPEVCRRQNARRGRRVPEEVLERQFAALIEARQRLLEEGYAAVYVIDGGTGVEIGRPVWG